MSKKNNSETHLRYPDQTDGLPELYPDKTYFTADTHFYSRRTFIHRPRFPDIETMNETLIANWNETVPEDGVVFHIGDFASELPMEKVIEVINRLHGTILLVLGNHDDAGLYRSRRFHVPDEKFQVLGQKWVVRLVGIKILLDHYPYLCYAEEYEGNVWQLFGHVHSGPNPSGYDIKRLQYLLPYQYDVGVDGNDYRPISFRRLQEIMDTRKGRE